jgi:undecaprenyl-phosphate alpha-N-acetylglucosaminyl 1-phosphatetransferase/UDP-N-acetylglucosamine 2-epimerase
MDNAKLVAASAIALAVTLFAIFSMRPLARRFGLVDRPGERKYHRGRVPLVGGLCFFFGTVVGLIYLGYVDRLVASLLVPCTLIVMTGVVDDLYELSVKSRLVIQACAAFLVIAATGVYFDHSGLLLAGYELRFGVIGVPITIIAVMGLMNAFNMLDGIDGLAASLAMVSIAAILFFFANASWPMLSVVLLLQILFASLIPYLCVNLGWPDGRKVFMGDAGSTLIGFLLAWSLIFLSHEEVARLAPVDALWCVALPVMDTLAVMYRRARKGLSPFRPDRQHLHHLLLDAGCSPRIALTLIVAASGLLAMSGYALRDAPEMLSAAVFLAVLVAYLLRFDAVLEWLRSAQSSRGKRDPESVAILSPERLAMVAEPSAAAHARPGGVLKTLCVMGASPDALQIGPIVRQLSMDARFEAKVCVATATDQAPEQVLDLFEIEPDIHLDVPESDGGLADISPAALGGMRRVLSEMEPDVVLVSSDASTTLATTLAAFSQQIPVVCVESGLPAEHSSTHLPDEASRRITCSLAALHFTATQSGSESLIAEGVPADRIMVTGNTAAGTLRTAEERIERDATLKRDLALGFAYLRSDSPLLLVANCTGMEDGFEAVRRGLRRVAMQRPDVDIVCVIDQHGGVPGGGLMHVSPNIHLIAPTDYLGFAYLLNQAYLILASSKEMAAEAASLGKPVLLMQHDAESRGSTEAGNVKQVGIDERAIASGALDLLADEQAYQALCRACDVGGDGDACLRIIEALANMRPLMTVPVSEPPAPSLQVGAAAESIREAS